MNGELLSAFFERDLTAGEEEELGLLLENSVDAAVSFAQKAEEFYESLGLPTPELPDGGEMGGGGAAGGNTGAERNESGGTDIGHVGPAADAVLRPGGIGFGWLAAALAGGILITGSVATYMSRHSSQDKKALGEKPAPQLEESRPQAKQDTAAKTAEERNVLRSIGDSPESRAKEAQPAGNVLVIRVALQEASPIVVTIYSQDGKQVFRKAMGTVNPGKYEFRWDGLDDAGNPAPAGDYRIVLKSSRGLMERILKVSAAN